MYNNYNKNNIRERIYSLLNNSKTKQAYSFGKSLRFSNNNKSDIFYHFYNLPSLQSNRATSLGYGKKCEYNKINQGCGSNKLYSFPSYFDIKYHNSPAYSFGLGKKLQKEKNKSPGPIYNISSNINKIPCVIFGKEGLNINRKLKKNFSFLGPGYYFNEKNHEINHSFTSNLMNSVNLVIGKEKRFIDYSKNNTPGPGKYNIPSLTNKSGIIFNSKYISSPGKSFLGMKNIRLIKRKKDFSPGPGEYNFFSIFEGYSKKDKENYFINLSSIENKKD